MAALRPIYRHPAAEIVLLLAVGWQIVSGIVLVIAGWKSRTGFIAWAQAGSGLYLALFLAIHVGAVLTARGSGVDTNFNFAAAGIHADAGAFFIPYYFLAVTAFGVHIGCALYWHGSRKLAGTIALFGAVAGAIIVAILAGMIVPVSIPPSYMGAFA